MLSYKILVSFLVLPFLVSCLTPVSGDECSIAYERRKTDEGSSEEGFALKKKFNASSNEEETEQNTWLIVPMNGLGVPNYGDDDLSIAEIGQVFTETSRRIHEMLKTNMIATENILPGIQPPLELEQECPFSASLGCDETYPYRNADGSCNNLLCPYVGKSSTPFERYLPAVYSDDAPEEENVCCICGLSASCYPIDIPGDDEYFGQTNRTCLAFRRSLPSPHLTCALGSREQLNRATSCIDASQVYGSDLKTQMELRTMTGGLMRTTPTDCMDLLPQTETYCASTEGNLCFLGGDGRVNLHPLLMAQYNIFVREHNRLANILGATYPDWCDETIFQEARKFLIAEMQHITNNEFLPLIIGSDLMEAYNLKPLLDGYSEYLASIYPATRNSFASAAFLYGYSGVQDEISLNGTLVPFASLFYNSDIFYNVSDAPTVLYEGLTVDLQKRIDRLMTEELTNKLSETEPGNGWDLAAFNIQSGRDNGLPTYNMWRRWCGLEVADNFSCLTDHEDEDKAILQELYECVDDIDLWTGGISEIHVSGGSVGPTFACITARQFQALKFGDRFWYESAGTHQLPIDALNAIRNVSMSRLLCDNTDIQQIQMNAFKAASEENPILPCTEIPTVDECALVRRFGDWCAWGECVDNQRNRSRQCTAPLTGCCLCENIRPDIQVELCVTANA